MESIQSLDRELNALEMSKCSNTECGMTSKAACAARMADCAPPGVHTPNWQRELVKNEEMLGYEVANP